MTRSLILGVLVLVAFVLSCAYAAQHVKWPVQLLGVAVLTVPACAACALVFKGRLRQ